MTLFNKLKVYLWPSSNRKIGSYQDELHLQARKFFFFIACLCSFVWIPYIEIDRELNPNSNFVLPLRYGLSIISIFLLFLFFTSSYFRSKAEWLMRTITIYVLLSVAIITAASEAHPNYVAGYFICLLCLSFVPQPLWHQMTITLTSVMLYFVTCYMFDVKFDTVAKKYGLQDTISVCLVCLVFGYALHRLRKELNEQALKLYERSEELRKVLDDRTEQLKNTYHELKVSLDNERKKESELEYYESVMTNMSEKILQDKEDERLSIADHIHGTVAQDLAISKRKIDELLKDSNNHNVAEGLKQLSNHIKSAISDTRMVVRNMNIRVLQEYGLDAALRELFISFETLQGLEVKSMIDLSSIQQSDQEVSMHLFRAAQELLNNVVKYAKVDQAFLSIRQVGDSILLTVSDEGVGTDLQSPELRQDGGFGLYRLRERTIELHGKFEMVGQQGEGLKVSISIPVPE